MIVKVIAIPLVLVSSLLSCILSYKYTTSQRTWTVFLRMFSAGVILSLALVHIISESVVNLSSVVEYPIGGLCTLAGIMVLLIVEQLTHSSSKSDDCCKNQHNDIAEHLSHSWAQDDDCCKSQHNDIEHAHTCITNVNSVDRISSGKKRSSLMVCIFEFACIFHSIFIGLSMGLLTDSIDLTKMLVALMFHQVLEGISLGSILSESNVTLAKVGIMMFTYSAATPIGITIGILVETCYDEDNQTKVIVTNCFQAFSGGLLLYVALFQIIAEEFSKVNIHKKDNLCIKLGLYVALILGASSMCSIALIL